MSFIRRSLGHFSSSLAYEAHRRNVAALFLNEITVNCSGNAGRTCRLYDSTTFFTRTNAGLPAPMAEHVNSLLLQVSCEPWAYAHNGSHPFIISSLAPLRETNGSPRSPRVTCRQMLQNKVQVSGQNTCG